ncbi:hypothetical protein OHW84_11060 [Acinetobacter baumannii]|nr:hypothetical protein [Acinetobacter baumannii]
MKFKLLIIQLCVIVFILAILFFSVTWIIIHIQQAKESFKEAMDLTIGFLGPVSTIFAAVVATYLFNDWKEQHNKTVIANEAKIAFSLICKERHYVGDLQRELPRFINKSPKIFFTVNDKEVQNLFDDLLVNLNESRSKLFEFVLLIEGRDLFYEILNYRNEIEELTQKIISWRKLVKSYDDVYKEYDLKLQNIMDLNDSVLNSLRLSILYKTETP